ncbi:unnamed protein product [Albugo candida]|nr:unnamed protein product [Albugo candida]|eukprot:CCI41313.1 unnamed protein product [Albugo candida]
MKNNTEMDLFHDENIDLQAQESNSSAGFLSFRIPPEELFDRVDTDHSGTIDKEEFEAMLKNLGYSVTATKSARIFRQCDCDQSGKIDRDEFKKALFMIDPITANSTHIIPTCLPVPRDVFHYFDEDGNGMIDDMEFADILEYFELEVSDAQKISLFQKYDRDKSGFIEYSEFRDIWLRLCDARKELLKRGIEVAPSDTPKQLRRILEQRLAQEELQEDRVEQDSNEYIQEEQRKEIILLLGRQALDRAREDLAAALDAAGQVYVFGTGKCEGTKPSDSCTSRDRYVSELWSRRINPEGSRVRDSRLSVKQKDPLIKHNTAPSTSQVPSQTKNEAKSQWSVHRRTENLRWTFQSPPKLDTRSILALRRYKSNVIAAGNEESETKEGYEAPREEYRPQRIQSSFQEANMMNTSFCWGRQVVSGAIGDDYALLVTSSGSVLEWGRTRSPRESKPTSFQSFTTQSSKEDEQMRRMRNVLRYYDVYESLPKAEVELPVLKSLLLAKVKETAIRTSLSCRGIYTSNANSQRLIDALGECLELEQAFEPKQAWKSWENRILELQKDKKTHTLAHAASIYLFSHSKNSRLLQEIQKMSQAWAPIRRQRGETCEHDLLNPSESIEEAEYKVFTLKRQTHTEKDAQQYSKNAACLQTVSSVAINRMEALAVMRDGSIYASKTMDSSTLSKFILHESLRWSTKQLQSLAHLSIQSISASSSMNAAITTNAQLYTWKSPSTSSKAIEWKLMDILTQASKARFVSCGAAHCGVTTETGQVFMWGCANGGRLGLGPDVKDHIAKPTLVETLYKAGVRVWQIACGTAHSVLCTEICKVDWKSCLTERFSGGELYACGSVLPLGRQMSSWEAVASKPPNVPFVQVSCGFAHSAAISISGGLFTWGRNAFGCTGHSVTRLFIAEAEMVDCIRTEPQNLATGKRCRQISVYNQQGAELALNNDIHSCIHTQIEEMPWWEMDLDEAVKITRICVWSCVEECGGPSTLFPFWILISQKPFQDVRGLRGLEIAKSQAVACESFYSFENLTEWELSASRSIGQYVRIQSQRRGFLRFGHIQVFGTHTNERLSEQVGHVYCGYNTMLVVLRPVKQSLLEDFYSRAIQADADNANILRYYRAYEELYATIGRGTDEAFKDAAKCELCQFSRGCEVCALYDLFRKENRKELPKRNTNDRSGLQVHFAVAQLKELELKGALQRL